jgi:hypothetical protein
MARRILILHDPDSSPNSYLHLFAGFELRQLDWRSYGFKRLYHSHADLIVPIAVNNEMGVVELLRSFRQNPIAIPIFPASFGRREFGVANSSLRSGSRLCSMADPTR